MIIESAAHYQIYLLLFVCTILAYLALIPMGFFSPKNQFPLNNKVTDYLFYPDSILIVY